MSFFNKILDTLGLGGEAPKKKEHRIPEARDSGAATHYRSGTMADAPPKSVEPAEAAAASAAAAAPAATAAVGEVDVVAKMEALAAANPQKLNWKTSIVDLLKLLGIDSSYGARKELATELGCPADLMAESAKMNVWLHKTVLKRIAENGGNVPADLMD